MQDQGSSDLMIEQIVNENIHNQETSLKIRLLKRQNKMNLKQRGNLSLSEESLSSSPTKVKSDQ